MTGTERMSMTRETGEGGPLDLAIHRLDRALAQLEVRATTLLSEAESHNGGLFDLDRAKLAAELDAARSRERALQSAGAQASEALGRAIVEIRAALGEDEDAAAETPDDETPDDGDGEDGFGEPHPYPVGEEA
jgi:hypothetical protein